MPDSVSDSIYEAISSIRLIDPHTHINPYAPASKTLADLLGYHYYTELAHSAGMPKSQIEEPGIPPEELVRRLVLNLSPLENTAQYRWLIEICRMFFGFDGDRLDANNWESVYRSAERQMRLAEWPQLVLDQSNVEAVFLTNDFDDSLDGFDTDTYIPCLRTDDLVFHLPKPETQRRLKDCSGIELDGSLTSLRAALEQRFDHFVSRGARACAISLPPSFEPTPVADGRAKMALSQILQHGLSADPAHQTAVSRHVFWTLAELCDHHGIPFDLMIGVNRGVYRDGVFQGQDLYDSRVSLIQYKELFNAFPDVKFPISVLASVTNQELVSYAWIFPNVITNGHWWYSNTPSFIARDAAARLEAVPCTKQVGYYSDAYKLEFVWPKFDMYRRVLSNILAEHFVKGCRWGEERAIELGRRVLRDNVDSIFPRPGTSEDQRQTVSNAETWNEDVSGTVATISGDQWATSVADEAESAGYSTRISDTVRMDESDTDNGEFEHDLDPLPDEDEVESVGLENKEMEGFKTIIPDAESLEAELDPEPLDVGDITGEADEQTTSQIRMLRGDGSFEADEESLQVQPDPMTGELRMPEPEGEGTDSSDSDGDDDSDGEQT
ncbi:MAG: glucuronate isomerase [Planctomycetota bacterium]